MLSAIQRKSVATRLVYFRKTVLATRSLKVESIQPCSSSLLSPPRKPCLQDFSPITTRRSNLVIPAKSIIIATDSIINALYNTAEKYGLTNEHIDLLATEAGHTTLDRTQEKQKLKDVIKNQNSNGVSIVYIVGEPEVGKTQLVREYAEKDYPGWIAVTGRTVLTLDMTEFLSSYHQVATKLDINTDFGNGQEMDLGKIAKEMKKKLLKRGTWLLIIDNYNSKDFEYIDEGYLERELLPLQQPSVNEWGTGLVLVTTNNAGVIPQDKVAGSESTITVDPLSVEESAKLIGTLTEYELSENETQKLTTTTDIKNWRYIPPVMARIGKYIGLRRKQEPDYDFEDYVEELERGETKDPEEESSQSIRSALLNMTKASDAISMTFKVLAMIPDYSHRGIPLVLLERLMKVNNKEEWAHKIAEVESCTVLMVEYNSKNDYKYIKTHKRYLDEMRRIAGLSNTKELTTEQRHLVGIFIGCIIEVSEQYCSVTSNNYTQPKLVALYELLNEFSIGAETSLDQELNIKIDQTLSKLRQMLRKNSTT